MDPNFSFPFQPYDIQKQFMTELYFTIQDKKLGIFESPTGTVSTLRVLPDFMDIFLFFISWKYVIFSKGYPVFRSNIQ